MNHLRTSVLALLVLVAFFFNIERLDLDESVPLVDLQTFVYILGFAIVVLTLVIPLWRRLSPLLPLALVTVLYFAGKTIFFVSSTHPLVGDFHTFVSLAELAFLWLCFVVSRRVAGDLSDLEATLENITFGDLGRNVRTLAEAEEDIETEFLRSRRHHHDVAVIIFEPKKDTIQAALHRTVEQVQRAMMSRYVVVSIGRAISTIARRSDMVLAQNERDRYIVVCPETDTSGSRILAERIQSAVAEQLGVDVAFGIASFPGDALTFRELVHQAGATLKAAPPYQVGPTNEKRVVRDERSLSQDSPIPSALTNSQSKNAQYVVSDK